MSLSDPIDTLAYHASRVLTSQRDMSSTPLKLVIEQVKVYTGTTDGSEASPEGNALWFYGMNHAVSVIAQKYAPLEPLAPGDLQLVEQYHSEMVPRAVRAFYYLLLICTREARHNQSLKKHGDEMAAKFGQPIRDFFDSIKGGESTIHKKLLSKPPATTIGAYCECLVWQFYNCSWAVGYGGKAWGNVADCLYRFVIGEYSPEIMLDTVWTLSHNNGPVFNKGLYYGMYYSLHLLRILDIQRSGQMPEAIMYDAALAPYVDATLAACIYSFANMHPEACGPFVDWFSVEMLGAVGKYDKDQQQQVQAYGVPDTAGEMVKKKAEIAKAKVDQIAKQKAKEAAKKAEYDKYWFQVMPGVTVKLIQRAA